MRLDVATGGELARRAGGRRARPSGCVLHGNNKSIDELRARPRRRASAGSSSTRFDELDRLEALVADGRRAPDGAAADHAGRRGPHPRVRAHRPGRLEVRVRAGDRRRRPRPSRRAPGSARGRAGRPARAHRQPGLRRRLLPRRPSRRWPRSSSSTACPSCRRRRPRRRLRRGRGGADDHRVGRRRSLDGVSRRRASTARVTAEPGRAIVAAAAVTLYRSARSRTSPASAPTSSVDGGMSDNPRPVLYGSGYETFLPAGAGADAAAAGPPWSASTASRATSSSASAKVPGRPRRRRRRWPRRSPAPTATRWARTTTRCPGPPVVFVRRRRGPPGRAARDRRRPARHRRRLTVAGSAIAGRRRRRDR